MEILEALENGQLKRTINADKEIALAKQASREYLSKSKNITLRLNMMDLKSIKSKSKEVGIPYQTIIGALIHQYVEGKVKLA